jgi:hypothetical protein
LRKYKINNPKFVKILNERSKTDDVTHAPGVATISAWRCEARRIAPRHHEGLRLWLGKMKEEEEGEEDGKEEEEEEEEEEKGTGDEVAEISEDQKGEEGEEDEEKEKESELETYIFGSACILQQARRRRQAKSDSSERRACCIFGGA